MWTQRYYKYQSSLCFEDFEDLDIRCCSLRRMKMLFKYLKGSQLLHMYSCNRYLRRHP